MSQDYSNKVAIYEHDGMEALIRGLSETDPDVQKNSVEAVGLLLQVSGCMTFNAGFSTVFPSGE